MPQSFAFYLIIFIFAASLAIILTPVVKSYALRFQVLDEPRATRKIHRRAVPLLGGWAVYGVLVISLLLVFIFIPEFVAGYLKVKHLWGLGLAGLLLLIGGTLDDIYNLRPLQQLAWPVAAALMVIISGIGIDFINFPFLGVVSLNQFKVQIFTVGQVPFFITILADLFTFLWLLGVTYTTKILDGIDGLTAGVSMVGGIVLFFLSLSERVMQPETALLAAVFAGALAGFLIFNFHPAKIFLGEGGSTLCGFILGVLAIISGGKIATALLILGLPIIDLFWVIMTRFFRKESPLKTADQKHLHFQLLNLGLTQRQAVLIFYLLIAVFGAIALTVNSSHQKLISLIILSVIAVSLITLPIWAKMIKSRLNRSSRPTSS